MLSLTTPHSVVPHSCPLTFSTFPPFLTQCSPPSHASRPEHEGRDGGNDDDVEDEFDDDEETVKGMARLFCEVAEAYIQLILAATPQVREDPQS